MVFYSFGENPKTAVRRAIFVRYQSNKNALGVPWPTTVVMSESPPSTDSGFAYLSVSPELRDRIRVEKAESGQTYDDYLRENLSLSVE